MLKWLTVLFTFLLLIGVIFFGNQWYNAEPRFSSEGFHTSVSNPSKTKVRIPVPLLKSENFIADYSFENTAVSYLNVEKENIWLWSGEHGHIFHSPLLHSSGSQSAVVITGDNASRPYQYIPIAKMKEKTIMVSAIATAVRETSGDGIATIEIWAVDEDFNRISELLQQNGERINTKLFSEDKFKWKRMQGSIDQIPTNTTYLEITLYSNTKPYYYIVDNVEVRF